MAEKSRTPVQIKRPARRGTWADFFTFVKAKSARDAAPLAGEFKVSLRQIDALKMVRTLPPLVELRAIESGIPARAAWGSLESVGFTAPEIARVVGISDKTMQRKEQKAENLAIALGDRTMRLMRVTSEAAEAIGDIDKALLWMRTPSRFLGGKPPLQLITTEAGVALVRQSLGVIAYGGVA